jgi:hypothetical protein
MDSSGRRPGGYSYLFSNERWMDIENAAFPKKLIADLQTREIWEQLSPYEIYFGTA